MKLITYKVLCVGFSALFILPRATQAQTGNYILPDVLTMSNGKKVTSAAQWTNERRTELLSFFTTEMYGQMPPKPQNMKFKVFDTDANALGGKATRKQVTVYFNRQDEGPQMDILIYIPNNVTHAVPAFLGLNFDGNQAVCNDKAVKIARGRVYSKTKGVVNGHATEASRGINEPGNLPIDSIIDRGYAVATIYRGDIDPDFNDGFSEGVRAIYPELQNRGDNFSTVGAWAWGLSRALDYLETEKTIDAKRVAVIGFSRLGKAALWAGANDERFAMVISNESGAGGAKLFHETAGERIRRLCTSFPNWFCTNFHKYIDKDSILTFDQHEVIALIAPRPVYVASAQGDLNSNPYGEFLGAKGADPVYKLLGADGMPQPQTFPALNTPLVGRIAYHIRPGMHNITQYDWNQYLAFADKYLRKH